MRKGFRLHETEARFQAMLHGRFRVPLPGRYVQGNGRVGQQDHVPRATASQPAASELRRQPKGTILVINFIHIRPNPARAHATGFSTSAVYGLFYRCIRYE